MPIELPASFDDIERPRGDHALVWLVELQLVRPYLSGLTVVPSFLFRLTSHHEIVNWPASSPLSEQWHPFNFSFSPIEQTTEGDLPQIELSVDNTTRTLMRYLHDGDGMEGNYCTVFGVMENGLGIAYPNHEFARWDFQVAGAQASGDAVSFRLERANFFDRLVPQDRFTAGHCRWEFGGRECGYVINAVAAFTDCPRTVLACVERGQDHASRGLPVLHPARFGGTPGVPKQR